MKEKTFNDFLQCLRPDELPLASVINELFMKGGCVQEIKEAASGLTVSYILAKKTVANFVCRKTGLKIRITPYKPLAGEEVLSTFPEGMKKDIIKATVCKRLLDDSLCNSRCLKGYDFMLDGENYKKCRSMAFLFAVTEENLPFINKFLAKSVFESSIRI